jgi:hypothetical protein
MIRSRVVLHAVLALSLALPTAARAQDPEQPKIDNRARAQQLFDSALADAEAGNFAAACPKFQASQEADPKTSTLLNLANCYEKNGQTASAWGAWREAETLARKISRTDWETQAKTRAEALEPKLVRLTIDVPEGSKIPGLTITRDNVKLAPGEWGVAIPVDPGEHVIAASAEGRVTWESKLPVTDASGAVTVPVLELAPTAPPIQESPLPPQPKEPASWWTPMRTAGVAAGGAGVVAVGTGLVLGLVAKGNYDDARAKCANGSHGCPASAVSDANGAYGLATGATVVFVIGAAALAAGTALVLLAPSPSTEVAIGPASIEAVHRW